jgi:SAM-dependent methyltransferase
VSPQPVHEAEAARIRAEYERREHTLGRDFYALFRPANLFAHQARERELRELLAREELLPLRERSLLEIGCGDGEWFASFERFGLDLRLLHGIELDARRIERARERAPAADLRVGDAARLPWPDGAFDVVFQSTVFSSVLDWGVRSTIAREMERVLKPQGVVVWYDFVLDNPSNPNVKGMRREEIARLFPGATLDVRRVTLAPPVARRLVTRSWLFADVLERLRLLNTHLFVAIRPQG